MKIKQKNIVFISLLGLYFLASLFFLDTFPFMHSDESWISGLTRTMMHEGVGATETFFDLMPRYPHAIKILFHLLQMPFILLFGYNLFAVRLLSLLFGCATIFVIYKIVLYISNSQLISGLAGALVAFDIQFIYASHLARQEILIVFGIMASYLYIMKNSQSWTYKNDFTVAAMIGLSIGVHPNAFIAALVAGSIYIYYIYIENKLKIKNLAVLVCTTALITAIYVIICYTMDINFAAHYLQYGDNLGVTMTFPQKIQTIVPYYKKIWLGVSGTYYTPWVKIQLVLFLAAFIGGIFCSFKERKTLLFLFPVAAVNIGYIIIGRYSQPSVILMFAVSWILIFYLISKIIRNRYVTIAVLVVAMMVSTSTQIFSDSFDGYQCYIEKIEQSVPQEAKVLANLNTEYAFSYGSLLDYRNLAYLDAEGITFAEYIEVNEIEYIIYPEEMDYIYETRPVWNIVYGNIYPYYGQMREFLENNCELIAEFTSPYAMRIVQYAKDKDWSIQIYGVIK